MRYTLRDYERIYTSGHLPRLPKDTSLLIKRLTDEIQNPGEGAGSGTTIPLIRRGGGSIGGAGAGGGGGGGGGVGGGFAKNGSSVIDPMDPIKAAISSQCSPSLLTTLSSNDQKKLCSSSTGLRRDKCPSAMARMISRLKEEEAKLLSVETFPKKSGGDDPSTLVIRKGGAVPMAASVQEAANSSWANIRSYKPSPIQPKFEKVKESIISTLQLLLNKVSDDTYMDTVDRIKDLLIPVFDAREIDDDLVDKIGFCIFEVASTNKFYSKLYADLYSELVSNFAILRSVLAKSIDTFLSSASDAAAIQYVNPEENYDLFCEMNKQNEKRRSLILFYKHLHGNKLISVSHYLEIAHLLLRQLVEFLQMDGRRPYAEEAAESLTNFFLRDILTQSEELFLGAPFVECIRHLSQSKPNAYPSLSSKTIFKCIDMLDV